MTITYPENLPAAYERLKRLLRDTVPDAELRIKAEMACEINRLKREKRAVILGHNYMEPALYHSVPDFTGDSLYLSRVASRADADRIVFCGVRFMAETAKILNPARLVLLPSAKAGCSLAESIRADDVRALKALLPGVPVVSYVNTYADVKAESDDGCTSGNAAAVVRRLFESGRPRVLFLPDEFLARNTAREVGAEAVIAVRDPGGIRIPPLPPPPAKVLIGWPGRCEVHEKFTVQDIERARSQFPDVVVLAHPECSPEVIAASNVSGGTAEMVRYVDGLRSGRLLLLTECAMGDNLAASCPPGVDILRLCSIRCPHMNEITVEETLASLRHDRYVIEVPAALLERARRSLDRMISVG